MKKIIFLSWKFSYPMDINYLPIISKFQQRRQTICHQSSIFLFLSKSTNFPRHVWFSQISGASGRREAKITKMVALMITAFLVAWSPYAALALAAQYFDVSTRIYVSYFNAISRRNEARTRDMAFERLMRFGSTRRVQPPRNHADGLWGKIWRSNEKWQR